MNRNIIIGVLIALIGCILLFKSCDNEHQIPVINTSSLIAKQNALQSKIDTFKVHDTVLVAKWKQAKTKTDTIYDTMLVYLPDTCQPFFERIRVVYDEERELAQQVISNKDSIIHKQDSIIILGSMIISEFKQENDSLRTTIKTIKKKRLIREIGIGAKSFTIGFGAGVVARELITK